jgi:hypothetical protein
MSGHTTGKTRGVFLSLDSITAMLLLFIVVLLAFSYIWGSKTPSFSPLQLRANAQDVATVVEKKGCLTAPLISQNNSDTSCISEVLRASPSSVCTSVTGYGTIVPDGLVGYWKFDETSGTTTADSSGYGNTGLLRNNDTGVTIPQFEEGGRSLRSIVFDGTNYVEVNHSSLLSPTSQISVVAWVYVKNWHACNCDHMVFVSKEESGGYQLAMNYHVENGSIEFSVRQDDNNAYPTLAPNVAISSLGEGWREIVGTYNGRYAKLYVDGSLRSTIDGGSAYPILYTVRKHLIFGATAQVPYTDEPYFFNGTLDEVRIYNRALSAAEVSQLYTNPSNILYVVEKPGCTYSGGEIQSITVPFTYSRNQDENNYYYAVVKSWLKGTRA